MSILSILLVFGCSSSKVTPVDVHFETVSEYVMTVLNDEGGSYAVDEPKGYEAFSYTLDGPPADVSPDGVTVGPIGVYIADDIEDAQMDIDYIFYLKVVGPDDCYGDLLTGKIKESECPNITTWYGPFEGTIFSMME